MKRCSLPHGLRLCTLLVLSMALGCEGPAGQSGLVRMDSEAPGDNCATGGTAVHAGVDADGDGALSDEEIGDTQYVCNGAAGSDGTNGNDGANGNDGTDGTDGNDGADGTDGAEALVSVADEAPGEACPAGGVAVRAGVDADGDGALSEAEAGEPTYVCNGTEPQCTGVEPLVVNSVELEQPSDPELPPVHVSGETYNVRLSVSGGRDPLSFDYLGTGATLGEGVAVDGEAGSYDFAFTPSWAILARQNAIVINDGCSVAVATFEVGLVLPNPSITVTMTPPALDWGGGTTEVCWSARDLLVCTVEVPSISLFYPAGAEGCVSVDVTEQTIGTVSCGNLDWQETTEFTIEVGPAITGFRVVEPADSLPTGGGDVVLAWDAYFVSACTLSVWASSAAEPVLSTVPTSSAGYTVAITEENTFELSCTGVDDVGAPLEVSSSPVSVFVEVP